MLDDPASAPVQRSSRRSACAFVASACALAMTGLRAQASWPSRPIRLVQPFAAGGPADITARAIGGPLGQDLGGSLIVESRPGADGLIAVQEVLKAPPDGHVLLYATATQMSYLPATRRTPPFDPGRDLTPISLLGRSFFLLAVSPALAVSTLDAFIAHVRANPGRVVYGSAAAGPILAMAQLTTANRLEMTHVPYKGEAQAVVDLVGGRVHAMILSAASARQLVPHGFRLLAVLMPARLPAFPDVPTFEEAGHAEVSVSPWTGLFGPAGMPPDIVRRIAQACASVLKRADVVEQCEQTGLRAAGSSSAELAALVEDQARVWADAMRAAGMQPT